MSTHNAPTTDETDIDDESPTTPTSTTEATKAIKAEPSIDTDKEAGTDTVAHTDTEDAEQTTTRTLEALLARLDDLEATVNAQQTRIADLETSLETKQRRIDSLESQTDRLEKTCETLSQQVDTLDTESTARGRRVEAISKKTDTNKARISELQSRELEKGAHLRDRLVDEHAVDVPDGRLERLTKDDGDTYYRLPEQTDPLDRGDIALAYGDLLPMQQLARMDEDMLRSATNALPTRLAAKLWQARTDPAVGDNPWERGCKDVAEYVKAGDLKHWIRRQEPGVNDAYAKKLVSRVIDAILDLSKHRLAVRKRTERKNGLGYTERRLVLPTDAAIPGETGGNQSR